MGVDNKDNHETEHQGAGRDHQAINFLYRSQENKGGYNVMKYDGPGDSSPGAQREGKEKDERTQ